jgi:hypothetical protein
VEVPRAARIGRFSMRSKSPHSTPKICAARRSLGSEWTPSWEVQRLSQWREREVDHVIINIDADPANLRRFGKEVIPAVAQGRA